ncbi:MAG: tRNA pseudouridine(38-40) synthase TruA [Terriglobales bacterium]
MPNFRLTLAYDGTGYRGWQAQPCGGSIQQRLAAAIAEVTGECAIVHGSGRTDAGVHALAQVAHVHLAARLPPDNLQKALNARLPPEIRVLAAEVAAPEFHARRDAAGKTYRYRWYRGRVCPPFLFRYVHHYPFPLQEAAMAAATERFVGRQDFTSFAAAGDRRAEAAAQEAAGPGPRDGSREIYRCAITREGEELALEVTGSGFLRHMVRNLAGFLVEVGRGRRQGEEIPAVLAARDRRQAGPTAPARGLSLVAVYYPPWQP